MSIRDIYSVIAELPIGDVNCRSIDQLELLVQASDCPVRIMLPATAGDMGFIAIGVMSKMTWTIRDLCLWQPVIEGSGVEQCANEMLGYIEQYSAALRGLRAPTVGSNLVSVTFQIGPVPWADTDYWAVDTVLTVEEYDP